MLALCFWPLLGLPLTYASTTVLSASDPSLVFSPGWTQEFSQATQDSFLQTNSFGGALTVTLPSAASSVDYVGFLTAGGSMYGYTLDCEEDCVLQTVNGSDPSVTNDTTAAQSTIFSLDLDPSFQHTLSVYNIPSDSPNGSSQINFNNLNVNIQDDAEAVPGALTVSVSPQTAADSASSTSPSPASTSSAGPVSVSVASSSTSTSDSANAASDSASAARSSAVIRIGPTGSSTSAIESATPTTPIITPSSPATSAASSSSATGGVSKSLILGISILVVVLVVSLVVALVVFLRQRRERRRHESFQSAPQPPLSPNGSIIPIMRPPQMRTISQNPFSDPFPEGSLNSPQSSSIMQRRMETRPASPGAAPTIPLPQVPLNGQDRMDGRSNTPISAFARNDLWITRSPRTEFFAV